MQKAGKRVEGNIREMDRNGATEADQPLPETERPVTNWTGR
jgi:hypothetical protein